MEKECSWENDNGFISIVKTEPEDFLSVEYDESNEQSEFISFGNEEDPPDQTNQHGNEFVSEEFHFKQEGIDTVEDMDYRMESYQGEHFYPQEAANNMEVLGGWQYRNEFSTSETNRAFLDQPGTSDMSVFAEKREEQLYPCRYCEYVGTHPRLLSSHMNNRHIKSVVYQCPHCPYNSTISRSTKDHVETKHENEDDKPIEIKKKCEFCDYSASNATALKNHLNKHTREKQHQCSFCEFNTLWEGYLKMHIRRKHGDQTMEFGNAAKEYPCQYCNYKALTPSSLKLHTNKHTREEEHQCPYCPYKTVWTTYIKLHIKNKHFKSEKSPCSKEHACSFCDYRAKNATLLKQHLNKHTREKINQCPHCPFTTLWITYMKLHIKRKHTVKTEGETITEKRDFQCNYCPYKAISSSHLKIHENKHTKAVEYKCEECDFKTTWYGYLKLHTKRKHSIKVKEENPTSKTTYPCNFCSYKAINLSTLKVHQNKHTREVLYNCPHCDFKTTWRAYIKMHIEKHNVENFKSRKQKYEGIKSFPCQYCDYNATQLGSLKLHVNSKHTRKILHKCPKCDYQCAVYGNLKMHIRRKHGLKPEADGKYHCRECEFSSENSSELKIHLNEKHDVKIEIDAIKKENDKVYSCQHCSYQTLYPQVMEKHINKHTRQNVFKCPHCPYTTVWNHYMKVHIRRHSEPKTGRQRFTRPNTDQNRMFPCQFCDHRSISSSSLRDHVNSVHTREVFFKCPYCEHKCTLKGNLRGHIRRKHPAQFVETEKRYSCNLCDFKTSLMRNLKIHQKNEHNIDFIQVKTENGEFPCQYCDYKARSYYALKIHTNKHTKENSYRCPECEFETRWPNYLSKHIQQHSLNKRKVTCLYCDYKGCSTFRLRKHIEGLHKVDKHYPCPKPKCEFKTIHYTSLRIHLKGNIHADGRKKSSMSVTRNFTYKYEPNEGRYFACDYCDYASKTQGNLDLHTKNKHEKKTLLKCGLCNYKTPSKSYLNRHFKNKHSVKVEEGKFTEEPNTNLNIFEQGQNFVKEEPKSFVTTLNACEINDNSVETRRCQRQRNSIPSYFEEETEDEISSDTIDFKEEVFEKYTNHLEDKKSESLKGETAIEDMPSIEMGVKSAVEMNRTGQRTYDNIHDKKDDPDLKTAILQSLQHFVTGPNTTRDENSGTAFLHSFQNFVSRSNTIRDENTGNQIHDNMRIADLKTSILQSVQHFVTGSNTTQIYPRRRTRIKLTPRRVRENKIEVNENTARFSQNSNSLTTEIIEIEDGSEAPDNKMNNEWRNYRLNPSLIYKGVIEGDMCKVAEETSTYLKPVSTTINDVNMPDNSTLIDHLAQDVIQNIGGNNLSKEKTLNRDNKVFNNHIIDISFSDSVYAHLERSAETNKYKVLKQERTGNSDESEENLIINSSVVQNPDSFAEKNRQKLVLSNTVIEQGSKVDIVPSEDINETNTNIQNTFSDSVYAPLDRSVQTNKYMVLKQEVTEDADEPEENLIIKTSVAQKPESEDEKNHQKAVLSITVIEKGSKVEIDPSEDINEANENIQNTFSNSFCAPLGRSVQTNKYMVLKQEVTEVADEPEENLIIKTSVVQKPESEDEKNHQKAVLSNTVIEQGSKVDIVPSEDISEANKNIQNTFNDSVYAPLERSVQTNKYMVLKQEVTEDADEPEENLIIKISVVQKPESDDEKNHRKAILSNIFTEKGSKVDIISNEGIHEANEKFQNTFKDSISEHVERSAETNKYKILKQETTGIADESEENLIFKTSIAQKPGSDDEKNQQVLLSHIVKEQGSKIDIASSEDIHEANEKIQNTTKNCAIIETENRVINEANDSEQFFVERNSTENTIEPM